MAKKSKMDDGDLLARHVKSSECLHEVLQRFGLTGYSDNYSKLRRLIEKYKIDTSHFRAGERRAKALRKNGMDKTIPLNEILEGKHPEYKTYSLSARLKKENIFKNECSECGQPDLWNNKPLTLQLDHIDGNRHNHKKDNLRFLCPNCHTQTSTWGRRNKY